MKKLFMVSLVKNGMIGGSLAADSEAVTYRTGKLTVPPEYRYLEMKYRQISFATAGWLFILPTVTITMRSGREYQFAVFFGRKRLMDTLKAMGVEGYTQ